MRIDIKLGEGLSGTTEWQVEVASRRAEEIGRVANWLCNVGRGGYFSTTVPLTC